MTSDKKLLAIITEILMTNELIILEDIESKELEFEEGYVLHYDKLEKEMRLIEDLTFLMESEHIKNDKPVKTFFNPKSEKIFNWYLKTIREEISKKDYEGIETVLEEINMSEIFEIIDNGLDYENNPDAVIQKNISELNKVYDMWNEI